MGTFAGHVCLTPGYVLLGVWYIVQATRRYCQSRIRQIPFVSSIAYPADFFPGRFRNFPIESALKVCGPIIYIPFELAYSSAVTSGWHIVAMQHITIAFSLMLAGVAELLTHNNRALLDSWDYVANGSFFLVESLTIYFHLHGSQLEVRLHVLFLLDVALGLLVVAAEAKSRGHLMLPLLRGVVFMLKGTWLFQIGFILYNPFGATWDETLHTNITLTTIHFSWHVISCIVGAMMVSVTVACFYRRKGYVPGRISGLSSPMYSSIKTNNNSATLTTYSMEDTMNYD